MSERPPVEHLLRSCRPSNIAGYVRTVIVDAVYGVIRGWSGSYVIEKGLERRAPSMMHRDTASAVVFVSLALFVKTTTKYLVPAPKFFCRLAMRGMAVDGRIIKMCLEHVDLQAATTSGGLMTSAQRCRYYGDFVPAVTEAAPQDFPIGRRTVATAHKQATESLTHEINKSSRHEQQYVTVSQRVM